MKGERNLFKTKINLYKNLIFSGVAVLLHLLTLPAINWQKLIKNFEKVHGTIKSQFFLSKNDENRLDFKLIVIFGFKTCTFDTLKSDNGQNQESIL